MKTLTLLALLASFALATNATAATPAFNSKANMDVVLAPNAAPTVLTARGFDATRLDTKMETVARADFQVAKINPATAATKAFVAAN